MRKLAQETQADIQAGRQAGGQRCHTLRMSNVVGFDALVIAMFSRTFPILKSVQAQRSAKFKRSCRIAYQNL